MPDLPRLFSELIRLEIELWNAVDTRLRADCDLSLARFEPMRIISTRTACRVNDIADVLSITVGGTSKLVDRLEASGHVRRRANPEDRRSSIIELTDHGRAVLAQAGEVFEDELRIRLGSVLPTRELEQFSTTLSKLRSAGRPARTEGTD